MMSVSTGKLSKHQGSIVRSETIAMSYLTNAVYVTLRAVASG